MDTVIDWTTVEAVGSTWRVLAAVHAHVGCADCMDAASEAAVMAAATGSVGATVDRQDHGATVERTRQTCAVCGQSSQTYTTVDYPGGRRFHFCIMDRDQGIREAAIDPDIRAGDVWTGDVAISARTNSDARDLADVFFPGAARIQAEGPMFRSRGSQMFRFRIEAVPVAAVVYDTRWRGIAS